jgi:hypothetical protein
MVSTKKLPVRGVYGFEDDIRLALPTKELDEVLMSARSGFDNLDS